MMSVHKQVDDQSLYLLLSLPLEEAVRIAAAQALDRGIMLSHHAGAAPGVALELLNPYGCITSASAVFNYHR